MFSSNFAVTDPGGGSGGSGPPLSDLTLTTLRLKFLHRQDRISLFNWLIFFNEACVAIFHYDLFASARKAVFPAPAATGVHRLRNTWSSLLSQLVDNYGDNYGDNSADNHVLSTSQIQ